MEQLSMPVAEVLRDVGMKQAVEHANRVVPGWSDAALASVMAYAIRAGGIFTAETLTANYYADPNHVAPPTDKSFGAVVKKALKLGLIEFVDTNGKRAKGHCSPCNRYRSKVYGLRFTEVLAMVEDK